MSHKIIMWHEQANAELWRMAMDQVVFICNNLPKQDSRLSSAELISGRIFDNYYHLQGLHVFGAPCFVLDTKLQDRKSLTKWKRCARQRQYLGISKEYASNMFHILNITTGNISPQFHVVHDNLFSSVVNVGNSHSDDTVFIEGHWGKLVASRNERYMEKNFDRDDKPILMSHLHDEWLTKKENENRTSERRRRWLSDKEKVKEKKKVQF